MYKTKLHKTYNWAIKAGILLLAYYVIYKQVFAKESWTGIHEHFSENYSLWGVLLPGFTVVVLMLFNWGTESLKWQYLIRKNENISLFTSVKGVFSGVTISAMTPNRMGEYFGRIFVLKKTHPVRGILMTIVGSISQLLATVVVGGCVLIFVLIKYPEPFFVDNFVLQITSLLGVLLVMAVLGGIYFNIHQVSEILRRLAKKRPKINSFLKVFSYYSKKELLNIFMLSLLRYMIFSGQFFILMRLFNLNFSLLDSLCIIALIFLGITVIPSVALAALPIRGTISFFVVDIFASINTGGGALNAGFEFDILAASSMLWLINIVIPALMGSVFILTLSFFKDKNDVG
ncbi:MAG: lysylphosphatidylglycerol synthase transmembrane domain-containing protein [Bacteroidales bacterium]